MNEFPFSSYNCFPNLQETGESEYTLKDRENALPMMYSIKATYSPELAKQK
jgi:hypothetical protein